MIITSFSREKNVVENTEELSASFDVEARALHRDVAKYTSVETLVQNVINDVGQIDRQRQVFRATTVNNTPCGVNRIESELSNCFKLQRFQGCARPLRVCF